MRERAASSFDTGAMTVVLEGGSGVARRRDELLALIAHDEVFSNAVNHNLSRAVRYERAIAKSRRLLEICARENLSGDDMQLLYGLVADDSPMMLHALMFIPNIVALGDAEQCAAWLPDALAHRMIGCYAQTELGHGSNVRGIQTTATYDAATEEFVINTPQVTAAKWWPGSLGKTANTAMVIAQLVVDGTAYGVHNFLVPLRDRATHLPLPGVALGDIGPKIGFNNMDNGWAVFRSVRIPRRNMAARYSRVEVDGSYAVMPIAASAGKTAYITMMQVRALIVANAGRGLAQAATIAIRYSIVRRQGYAKGASRGGGREAQVLDYATQAHRLLPLLATAYCWHFAGDVMTARLRELEGAIRAGDSRVGALLRAAHASFSGLKSLTSMIAADGMEECRRACGGAGFLKASGIPELLTAYLQNVTVEGDNHMLPAQVVSILLKELRAARGRGGAAPAAPAAPASASDDAAYLATPLERGARWSARPATGSAARGLRSAAVLIEAYTHRALRLLEGVAELLRASEAAGASAAAAWNGALIEMSRASRAHSFLVALRAFAARIDAAAAPAAPATLAVLRRLFALFALYWLERDMGDFVEDGFVRAAQADAVRAEVRALLDELRPDACALTDAWDFRDFVLQSAIGRYDGDVYPALFESATRSVLNQAPRGPGWRAPITAPAPHYTMFTTADDVRAASTPGSKL